MRFICLVRRSVSNMGQGNKSFPPWHMTGGCNKESAVRKSKECESALQSTKAQKELYEYVIEVNQASQSTTRKCETYAPAGPFSDSFVPLCAPTF